MYKPPDGAKVGLRLAGEGYTPPESGNLSLQFTTHPPYVPPQGSAVGLEFGVEGYVPPDGNLVGLEFVKSESGPVENQYLFPAPWDSQAAGAAEVRNGAEFVLAAGIASKLQLGTPGIYLWRRYVGVVGVAAPAVEGPNAVFNWNKELRPSGFNSQAFGNAGLRNLTQEAQPVGFVAGNFGVGAVWNWRQYRAISGFDSQEFGTPALLGGVKYVTPGGVESQAFGVIKVINTKADQTVAPSGIEPLPMGAVNVSPRIIYPSGILGTGFGAALVQRNPSPNGWDSAVYGTPLIYFKTRFVRPAGIEPPEPGFPRVADWARRILHVSSPVTSVFGDTTLRLKNYRVKASGIAAPELSDWTEVRNRNRGILASSIQPAEPGSPFVRNKTPSFTPKAFDASVFGAHDVGYQVRVVRPAGVLPPAPAFGLPSFWQTPALKPQGIAPPAVPVPTVQNAVRFLEGAGGSAMARHGEPTVSYRYRHIALGGIAASDYGAPRLEHRDRALALTGFTHQGWGTPLMTMARRFVAPQGIPTPDAKGANHFVGGTRWLRPLGFEATRWGTRIIPEAQVLYPLGFAGVFGWPKLENKHQYIKPDSIRLYKEPQQYFGRGEVFNSRQYVTMFYDVDSELNPPRWPQWTLIENRNKRMGATGWDASKVPAPRIENTARVLLPRGMAAPALPEWQKTGMVAFRIRPLHLDGVEPPYISSWANVRNAARLLKPAGLVATAFGTAKLENRSREFNRIGGWDSAWFGYPFVAPRIRELSFEARYTIAPPRVPLPTLQLHTRYIEPKGIEPKEVGHTSLDIRFNRITPRWTMVNYYGYPTVHNVTPELRQRGAAMDEWGAASVRLQWRPVAPDGTNMAQLGKPIIADSRRTISVPGTNMLRIGDKLTVTKTGVPPLALQYIWLDSLDPVIRPDDGHGIPTPNWPNSQFGKPSMQQQVIYPESVGAMTLFGQATVTANSIRVEPGIFDLTMGEPMVSLKNRTLTVKGIEQETAYGKPRLSPHTIYAVTEAPEQAQMNHPTSNLHLVRSWVEFGTPMVQNQHRRLVHSWAHEGMAFGQVVVHNARQYLYPTGRLMTRMGWPTLPGESIVEFYTTMDMMQMGAPTVGRPPYVGPQTIAPKGLVATAFDNARVEPLHRTVYAKGHDSAALGGPANPANPYMWQGLRVGPLMPTIPDGFNAERFGKTWVSLRVRELAIEGFDAFLCEYDYQAFAQRMRVRHGAATGRPVKIGKPTGWRSSKVGTPGIRNHTHYIRPDGNADQYRKGVPQ